MNELDRLHALSEPMELEPAEETGCAHLSRPKTDSIITCQATMPNGKHITLLKTLLTSACERNCNYCPFRAGRDFRRITFRPDEFATLFMRLYRAGLVGGLFISSGISAGGIHTQDQLLDTAEILRKSMGYKGYLHLKLMPGAEHDQVLRAMQLADRVSCNLEAPNASRLQKLAPKKIFLQELLNPLRYAEEIRRRLPPQMGWNGRWASSTTQFVVGGADESDLELLDTTEKLIQQVSLKRAYFSAFRPVEDTPLEDHLPTNPKRQDRLYQASYLLRDYGFQLEELPFTGEGNLPLDTDPKLAWANLNLNQHPVEINRASREELLRVPGLGPKSVQAILAARCQKRLTSLESLSKLSINSKRVAPFILLDGKSPLRQLQFAF
jgi:predicted DNA-binding helix-hairpin-helix protein